MYKILIADDEELEREALRFFINESSLDIDQVIECFGNRSYQAGDARQAGYNRA